MDGKWLRKNLWKGVLRNPSVLGPSLNLIATACLAIHFIVGPAGKGGASISSFGQPLVAVEYSWPLLGKIGWVLLGIGFFIQAYDGYKQKREKKA